MRKSNITALFEADIRTVWDIVTDNSNYTWRSDLSKIKILDDGKRFVEYTKNGFSTTFTVTLKDVCKRYEFDMENQNFAGHWIGIFTKAANGGTKIDFTEELNIKNPVMEVLSYLFLNLKKMQKTYVRDLREELSKRKELTK